MTSRQQTLETSKLFRRQKIQYNDKVVSKVYSSTHVKQKRLDCVLKLFTFTLMSSAESDFPELMWSEPLHI